MDDATYPEILVSLDQFAGTLTPEEQAARLYRLIAPLLDRLAELDEEFSDEPTMSAQEAVRGLRRAADGQEVDADAIYEYVVELGLVEDQDRELHVVSQIAYVAAAWLRLLAGRKLGDVEDEDDLLPRYAPSVFTQIVDLLAWTRSGQVYLCWEDAPEHPDVGDLQAATRELRAMWSELTG